MTPERLDEIRAQAARWFESDLKNPTATSVFRHRAELIAEVDRLCNAYELLAACVGRLDFDRSESAVPETQHQWLELVREVQDRADALIDAEESAQ
jgi:hypothetical protein